MPRMQRLEFPGSLVHIMARGIDGTDIFRDDYDRSEFLARLTSSLARTRYRCLCWCLMPNHYHLLLRTTDAPMSAVMRPLNSGYARWYNRKWRRKGYLYQDRFKSVLSQDMEYARQLIRYIHLNPIRGGLVGSLRELRHWPWCGHGYLLSAKGANGKGFQDRNEALRRFGEKPEEAVRAYLSYLREGIKDGATEDAGAIDDVGERETSGSHRGWPAVIGDSAFAQAAMERHRVAQWRKHRQTDYPSVLAMIAGSVCTECGIERKDLFRRGRMNARSRARALFCYRAHHEELLPFATIADYLGTTITPVILMARAVEQGRSSVKI